MVRDCSDCFYFSRKTNRQKVNIAMSLVTIVLPVYNGMPYLVDCINSIKNQVYKDYRLIIINDGSTDETKDYINSLTDKRITLIHQENMGLGSTLNRSIDFIETPFLARMDSDDLMSPDRIGKQIDAIKKDSRVVAIGGHLNFFNESFFISGPSLPLDHNNIFKKLLGGFFSLSHPTCMFRTEALRKIGGYHIPGPGQDLDLFIRMGEIGLLANLPDKIYSMRISEGSYSTRNSKKRLAAYDFALKSRKERQNGSKLNFPDFEKNWSKSTVNSVRSTLFSFSSLHYRKYLILKMHNKNIPSYYNLFLACLGRPFYTFKKVLRIDG